MLIHCAMLSAASVAASTEVAPEEPGPYAVGYYWVSFQMPDYGRYDARIYYPAKHNGWRAWKDASGGPYPGIVVGNGLNGAEWNLTWLPAHLASYGYVVLGFTPPNPGVKINTKWADGFVGGIATLESQQLFWFSPIHGLLDTETFGAIGFSMGGCGSLEAAADPDSVIDAVVSMACGPEGVPFAEDIRVPIQFQVGSLDGHSDLVLESYDNVTLVPKEYVEISGGNHAGFLDEFFAFVAVLFGIEPPADIPHAEQRRISSRYFTSWFNTFLKDDIDYGSYIYGDEAQNDLDSGVLSDLRYDFPSP
jgi:predicted dienelactone hydrolase